VSDRDRLAAELQRLVEYLAVLRDKGAGAGAGFTLAEQRCYRQGVSEAMNAVASCAFLTVLLDDEASARAEHG